jgi:hypothetical protein
LFSVFHQGPIVFINGKNYLKMKEENIKIVDNTIDPTMTNNVDNIIIKDDMEEVNKNNEN